MPILVHLLKLLLGQLDFFHDLFIFDSIDLASLERLRVLLAELAELNI